MLLRSLSAALRPGLGRAAFGLLLSSLVLVPATQGQDDSRPPLEERFESVLWGYFEADLFTGSVLVGEGDTVLFTDSVGLANRDWEIPNGVDTRFRLASITKQFTAMVVMQLVQEGAFALDSTLIEVLPDYAGEAGPKVTIRQLLNHTSGIPSYTDLPGFLHENTRDPFGVQDFVREFCSEGLLFEPGSRFAYNNSGYFLLGAIVEASTGSTYAEAVQKRIFEPCGMESSGYASPGKIVRKRASGYGSVLGHYRPASYIDMSIPYAAGSLYSTVEDMWRWHRALADNALLNGAGKALMFEPGLGNYGFGWNIRDGAVFHDGGILGFSTMIMRWPASQRCIIVLSNDEEAATAELAMDLGKVLAGEEVGPPQVREDKRLAGMVLEEGVEAGLGYLGGLSGMWASALMEGSLHRMAQGLWDLKEQQDALRLWEFNTAAFGTSVAAWDQLARVLEKLGRGDDAIEALIRAMELDPTNPERAAKLEALAGK